MKRGQHRSYTNASYNYCPDPLRCIHVVIMVSYLMIFAEAASQAISALKMGSYVMGPSARPGNPPATPRALSHSSKILCRKVPRAAQESGSRGGLPSMRLFQWCLHLKAVSDDEWYIMRLTISARRLRTLDSLRGSYFEKICSARTPPAL